MIMCLSCNSAKNIYIYIFPLDSARVALYDSQFEIILIYPKALVQLLSASALPHTSRFSFSS